MCECVFEREGVWDQTTYIQMWGGGGGKLKQGRQRYPGGGGGEREFSRQKENKCKIEVIKMANTK